nr:hypothetical protein [Tanacetum cinerariifolium]
ITLTNTRSGFMEIASFAQREVSGIRIVFRLINSKSSSSFLPLVLLWLAIIIEIVGVGVTVVVVAMGVVVESSSIVKLSFVCHLILVLEYA